jgi:hypothetical protein
MYPLPPIFFTPYYTTASLALSLHRAQLLVAAGTLQLPAASSAMPKTAVKGGARHLTIAIALNYRIGKRLQKIRHFRTEPPQASTPERPCISITISRLGGYSTMGRDMEHHIGLCREWQGLAGSEQTDGLGFKIKG